MTQKELLKMLDTVDDKGVWAFGIGLFKLYFSDEPSKSICVALKRHADNGLIINVCRGIYANPRAKSMPKIPLYVLPHILRSSERFYLSLETALSEYGLISQMPNRLVFMTSGRSQVFHTKFGIIEFVHSERNLMQFFDGCIFDEEYGFYVADAKKAVRDAKRTKRSVDLIDFEEYKTHELTH